MAILKGIRYGKKTATPKKPLINVKNLKMDIKDPDLKSYGERMPMVNGAAMKASLAAKKAVKYMMSDGGAMKRKK